MPSEAALQQAEILFRGSRSVYEMARALDRFAAEVAMDTGLFKECWKADALDSLEEHNNKTQVKIEEKP